MKTKVFIDGSAGTTGLRIYERFSHREDIELLVIPEELRKEDATRKAYINASDVTFLCLPDQAAIEAVSMVENDRVIIIDTSTAHRTEAGWNYGFPELSKAYREEIQKGKRIAVPGCHATGFISLVYPMIQGGLISNDYPISSFSITGYSGGGKKMIAEYEDSCRAVLYDAPREYGLNQEHKHLKEMQYVTGLIRKPLFSPIVADYYNGMLVSVPIYQDLMKTKMSPKEVQDYFASFYENEKLIQVMDYGSEQETHGFLNGNEQKNKDSLRIYITGNKERILLSAQFDNLGKGASGAAIQCMNLTLGIEETKGLVL